MDIFLSFSLFHRTVANNSGSSVADTLFHHNARIGALPSPTPTKLARLPFAVVKVMSREQISFPIQPFRYQAPGTLQKVLSPFNATAP